MEGADCKGFLRKEARGWEGRPVQFGDNCGETAKG
jgi:hypothetical protein